MSETNRNHRQTNLFTGGDIWLEWPDLCPLCHVAGVANVICAVKLPDGASHAIEAVFQCPNMTCSELFVGYYEHFSNPARLVRTAPRVAPTTPFGVQVTKLSPQFVEIFNQAMATEAANLGQMTGIGLRKAIEFLVKDFAIFRHPLDRTKIESMLLGPCIEAYVPDPRAKAVAKRAVWLGNDETHYVRRWEDRDIEDLKVLTALVVRDVESDLQADEYLKTMPEPKKREG
jgi:hypothetical protein